MPSRIQVLPEEVANQIAAGEVVERPASVAKELVENSLDAGATRVEVEIEEAGRRLLRVSDDGLGMGPEDLRLALRRHATSKLKAASDLWAIASFGFRGEALPSIASVSRFKIASRERGSQAAYELMVQGGGEGSLEEAALSQGTRVEVRDLFFNTPARLKFLKNPSTEVSRIQLDLLKLALAHPTLSLRLRVDGKLNMDFPRARDLEERAGQALGMSFLKDALHLAHAESGLAVQGWAGRPSLSRSNRSGQFLFINRRAVEHRLFSFTLAQAYGSLIPHGRHASALVFLDLPEGEVDVNVHPAKREVRFKDERAVLDAIRHAVSASLANAQLMAGYVLPLRPEFSGDRPLGSGQAQAPMAAWGGELPMESLASAPARHQEPSGWMPAPGPAAIPERPSWPVALSQLHRSYLLCQDEQGLVVVDQHAAHERVLYEGFCKSLESGQVKSQQLLLPQKLSLGPSQAARLRQWMPALAGMGLELSDLGEGIFYLQSIPSFLKKVQVTLLLQELLDELAEELDQDPLGAFRREVAAQLACRAAVKAGDAMGLDEMNRLMSDLSRCEIPWSCPHGRPPFVRLPLSELEKYFERR